MPKEVYDILLANYARAIGTHMKAVRILQETWEANQDNPNPEAEARYAEAVKFEKITNQQVADCERGLDFYQSVHIQV
jgi:hypothetical protein